MPFEPRILRVDDQPEEGRADSLLAAAVEVSSTNEAKPESWLPAELEALAEQLSEDSAHLLRQFPAAEHPAPRMAELAARMEEAARIGGAASRDRRSSYRALQRFATLAAGLLIVAGAGLWLSRGDGDARHASLNPGVNAGALNAGAENKSEAAKPVIEVAAVPPVETVGSRLAAAEVEASLTGAPVLGPEDFMELDSSTQSGVADLVVDGQLQQGTLSL